MKKTLFLFVFIFFTTLSLKTIAQHQLEGSVKSALDNRPLVGAQVSIKGKPTGTITDLDGNYSLVLSPKDRILVVKYGNTKPQEVDVSNKETADIYLGDGISVETVVLGPNTGIHTKNSTESVPVAVPNDLSKQGSTATESKSTQSTYAAPATHGKANNKQNNNDEVFICTSSTATVYHHHKCKGLEACKSEVKTTTVSGAKAIGRRACRYCYEAHKK